MKKLYTIYKQLNIKKKMKREDKSKKNKKKKITNQLKNKIRKWIHRKKIISEIFQRELKHEINVINHVIIKVFNIFI